MKIVRFCFAHKTASMFGHRILARVSKEKGFQYFSPNNAPANHMSVGEHIHAGSDEIILFGPSRSYGVGKVFTKAAAEGHAVLDVCQIRNPLDMIVSQYFSHGWIHPDTAWPDRARQLRRELQAGDVSIADYARLELAGDTAFSARSIVEKFRSLETGADGVQRRIVRYEQFYEDYDGWVETLAAFLPPELEIGPVLLSERPAYDDAVLLEDGVFYADPLDYVEEFRIGPENHIRSAAPDDHIHFLTTDEARDISAILAAQCPVVMAHYPMPDLPQ